jgi:hypothetical protein
MWIGQKTPGYSPPTVFRTKFDWRNGPRTQPIIFSSVTIRLAFLTFESYQMLTTLRSQWFPWPDPSEFYVDLVSGCFFIPFAHKTTSRYFRRRFPAAQATHMQQFAGASPCQHSSHALTFDSPRAFIIDTD